MSWRAIGEPFFRGCANFAQRRSWLTLFICLVLTALAGYSASQLRVSTETEDIFAADVEFLRNERAYLEAFPRGVLPVIAVVDAPTAERAQAAARALADRLSDNTLFRQIQIPGAEPYFQQNALLFLSLEEIRGIEQRMRTAGPALQVLVGEPNLGGIAEFLGLMRRAAGGGRDIPPGFVDLVRGMAEATNAQAAGRTATLSWEALFGLGDREGETRQLVLAHPVVDDDSLEGAEPALDALHAAIADVIAGQGEEVTIRVTGDPALRHQEIESAFSGALYASILSFGLVALTLVIGIRSWRLIFALLAALVVGTVWTSGLAQIAVGELNLISLAFGVLFFGEGVDFGTHVGLRYMERAAEGASPEQANRRAVVGEGPAITLSVICASIAYLSFLPTDYLGLAELGIISAIGMLVAFVVTVLLLPAVMSLLPPKPAQPKGDGGWFGHFVERRAWPILGVAALVTVAAGGLSTQARIDVNPLNLQDPDTEAVRTFRDLASDPQMSPYALNLAAPDLEAARELVPRLEQVTGVAQVRTIDSLIPDDQEAKRAVLSAISEQLAPGGGEPAAAERRTDEALRQDFEALRRGARSLADAARDGQPLKSAAQEFSVALDTFAQQRGTEVAALRSLDRALTSGLPPLIERLRTVPAEVSIDSIPADLRREWLAPDGRARVQILPADDVSATSAMKTFAERVQAVAPAVSGLPVGTTEAADVVRRSFAQAIAITAVAIAAILGLLRRRVSDVALIMAPLALASLWTIAGAALLGVPFNFANVIVIPLLLGLGVAASIHVVMRARQVAKAPGHGSEAQAGVLDTSTPRAVVLTDLTTAVAFVTLAISAHRGLASMGILLGLAITLSLIASLVVLPALLAVLRRR